MDLRRYVADYDSEITQVSYSYLLELIATLCEYYDSLVLIGGWVTFFILKNFKKPTVEFSHIGSIDIDLAVNPELFKDGMDKYRTIIDHISGIGYEQKKDRLNNIVPSSFVKMTKEKIDIQVDFLTSFDPTIGKRKRHLDIQPELMARRTKGCETAFVYNWECPLIGNLPNDGEIKLKVKIANIISSIVMKGQALGERLDGKDAYDIYTLVTYYINGPASVAKELKPYLNEPIIAESLKIIDDNFEKINSNGPVRVGYFLYPDDNRMREQITTDAFMNIRELFKLIK